MSKGCTGERKRKTNRILHVRVESSLLRSLGGAVRQIGSLALGLLVPINRGSGRLLGVGEASRGSISARIIIIIIIIIIAPKKNVRQDSSSSL